MDNLDPVEKFVFADSKEKNKKNSETEKLRRARGQFYHGGQESSPQTIRGLFKRDKPKQIQKKGSWAS